ncbi:hypothetical protein [Archangium primigenium]|uniref:hypothetical protein n=1 Tax=[Archangium] primigenium TaxID=2792470 RepID=UPI00195C94F0|nr:hypothetical protein [Archangium primigenium]MBM7114821.1 hypothetical protein [Archangium primigenium]
MNRRMPSWSHLGVWLCLSLPVAAWAKAPPPVKAVKLTPKEVTALEAPKDGCGLEDIAEGQSFRLVQKGSALDGRMLVGMVCGSGGTSVTFLLYHQDKVQQVLPRHRANDWDVYQVEAVAFSDVDGDGRSDIVTIVSSMAGAGPTAAVPFNVAGVWYQTEDGQFVSDPKAEAILEEVRDPTVKKAVAALKKARVRMK